MKIAFFHELPPGGARIATHQIASLLKKKHQVDLYYVDEQQEKQEEKNYTHSFFYKFVSKAWSGGNWKVRLYKDTIELFKLYLLHRKIARDIRKKKYDLIFINASKYIEAPFILRFPNAKKIFYLHDPHFRVVYEDTIQDKKLSFFRSIYHRLNRFILKVIDRENVDRADVCVANSVYTQETFKKTYDIASVVSYLGVTIPDSVSKDVKKEYDVLYIGSHDPLDDYTLLVDALSLLNKKIKVRAILKEDEWISREEMNKLYKKSRIVLALGKNEPFGLIPLEAMARGVPVIAINEGGYKETVINNKTGFLIKRSPKELANKISSLLENKALQKKLGKEAEEYVKRKWSWDIHIKKLEKIFNEARKTDKEEFSKNFKKYSKRIIVATGLLLFVFTLGLRLWNLNEMGRTWDEDWYVEQGYRYDKAILQGDFKDNIWYKDPDTPPLAKYVYGIGANFDIQRFENNKPVFNYDYTYTRAISAIMAALTAVIIFLIGLRYISLFVGIVAAVIFAMLPVSLGLTQLVTLESFILFFFTLSIFSFLYLLERITVKKIILTGIVTGLAISVKLTNLLLFPVFAGIYFSWLRQHKGTKRVFDYRLLFILPFAGIILLILWPSLILYFPQVLSYTMELRGSQSLHPIHETFFGIFMGVPIPYFVVYFLITTPIIILLFFLFGAKKISDKRQWFLYALIWWFVIPFIQSFYNYRQNGIRYIIQIYAPLSLIAAYGLVQFLKIVAQKKGTQIILVIPVFIYLAFILIQHTPYYLNYYNEVVGGTKTVYEKKLFPIGWWGDGMREAGIYLEQNIPENSHVGLSINPMHTIYKSPDIRFSPYEENKKYDYVVVNNYAVQRAFFNESVLAKDYKVIHTIYTDGAALVRIYKHN